MSVVQSDNIASREIFSKSKESMKVLILPYSQNNPYQQQLAASLEKYGVDVKLCNMRALPLLRSIWVYGKPDVLHLHWTDGFIVAQSWPRTLVNTLRFLIELLIVKLLGIKIVWTVHNLSNHENIKSTYENFVNRIVVHLYDQIIVHCFSAQESAIKKFCLPDYLKKRIHVIQHGHFLNCYENRISRQDARLALDYSEHVVLFLFFGNIRPYKGLLSLIDEFRTIDYPGAELLIAGKPLNDVIKNELLIHCKENDHIRTSLRFIPENELQIYMNAADIMVFPCTDILTSGTVLLAMSFGKAIVVPGIGCIPETLDIDGASFYDPNDINGLSGALRNILSRDFVAMGRYNRIKVEEFGWDEIARKTIDVYCGSGD